MRFGRINKIEQNSIIAFLGALYLFLSMQPFFTWYIPGFSLSYFILFITLLYVFSINNKLLIGRNESIIFLLFLIYSIYLALPVFGHDFLPGKILLFLPLLTLLILSPEILIRVFRTWKKILIFFSLYALVVYVLFALQIDIPHWKIENSEYIPVSSRDYHFYRVYGLVVSSTNTLWRIGGVLTQRICGPFAEPGHFGIYIGFTMLIDKFIGNKTNPILLITGILTLSPAFLIVLFTIEFYRIIIEKKINFRLYAVIIIILSVLTLIKGPEIRERILYITVNRHIDLDSRSPGYVREKYEALTKTPKLITGVGKEELEGFGGSLSDPRGMIAKFGVIGLVLSVSLIFLLIDYKRKYSVFLLIAVLMVYAHRVWMFESTYIYSFMLFSKAAFQVKDIKDIQHK